MVHSDDDALAARSRAGDPLALAILYRRHAPALLRFLERQLRDRDAAEDILQETFVRIFEGRGRYEERGRFRPWLFTVAARLASDRRREGRRHEALLQAHGGVGGEPAVQPSEPVLGERMRARIESALADLPRGYALALHLRVSEGFTYAEIAAMSGDLESTLRSRVHHGLRQLRVALGATRHPTSGANAYTDAGEVGTATPATRSRSSGVSP